MNLFAEEIEQQAIERIQKFAKIAKTMGFEVCLGFSGGKDSQVCYDLCKRSGIEFKAYYNVAFESNVTKCFIREYYPNVIWRRDYKFGFIENIWRNYGGLLPTVRIAYCCSGCIVCPKADFTSNYIGLLKYPKLIDAFILAREKAGRNGNPIDWLITSDKKDYFDNKPYYICRWLNHSFMPFTKKQEEFYRKVREKYDQLKSNKSNKK